MSLRMSARRGVAALLLSATVSQAGAAVLFDGVAAGDMTSSAAVLWTRAADGAAAPDLVGRLSTDQGFATSAATFAGVPDTSRDYTLKLDATGLQAGTQYFYRFEAASGEVSQTGSFRTAPPASQSAAFRLGFAGDVDGKWRPYPSVQDIADRNLDAFVFLGDTLYETASTGLPASANPVTNTAQALADYRGKYLENVRPVTPGGSPGVQAMLAAQGSYTLLDNHELGNQSLQAGGAPTGTPAGAGVDPANPAFDANRTGAYQNKTAAFQALKRAYLDYHPIREETLSAPLDPRSDGTQKFYSAQRWGANALFVNVDDRSYRDIRLRTAAGADDTGPRADNPDRTMLGATQLAWLKQTLLDAQAQGVPWKFVAISSPIDQVGPGQDGKSWAGGYRSERDELLKFIADNGIENIVFLSADDHQNRVNELFYTDVDGTTKRVPGALLIVDGPIGAGGPDTVTDHSFANLKRLADAVAAGQVAAGVDPLGLDPATPGLRDVYREGDQDADRLRQPIDFYSPDTFNYDALSVSADGRTLTVETWGINSYAANTFPDVSATGNARLLLSFQLDARTPVPEPASTGLLLAGVAGLAALRSARRWAMPIG